LPKYPVDPRDWKELGRTDEKISAIGLGTWAIRNYNRAYRVFVHAIRHGINHVDTAEIYDRGRAEEFVGRVARAIGRENLFITTKMDPRHLTSRDRVLKAGRRALSRLSLDCVDLYLIHWPNPSISIEEQVRNFEVLVEEGVARYIGVSNFGLEDLEKALHSTRKYEIVVDQVHYSILHKTPEQDLLRYAISNGVTIQAYTPLEHGRVAQHPIAKRIARKYGKTATQVALNYLISRPRVVAIPKTESIEHLTEILGSMGWRLSEEDIEALESA